MAGMCGMMEGAKAGSIGAGGRVGKESLVCVTTGSLGLIGTGGWSDSGEAEGEVDMEEAKAEEGEEASPTRVGAGAMDGREGSGLGKEREGFRGSALFGRSPLK